MPLLYIFETAEYMFQVMPYMTDDASGCACEELLSVVHRHEFSLDAAHDVVAQILEGTSAGDRLHGVCVRVRVCGCACACADRHGFGLGYGGGGFTGIDMVLWTWLWVWLCLWVWTSVQLSATCTNGTSRTLTCPARTFCCFSRAPAFAYL